MPTLRKLSILFATANAVAATATCDSVGPTQAVLYTYEDFGTYERVNSTLCGESYILYPRGQSPPDLGSRVDYKYFAVPLENVVVTQTTPISYFEKLGKRSAVKVTSEYTTSPCMAKLVEGGDVTKYVSPPYNATADPDTQAEHEAIVGDASVEAILSDPYYTPRWKHAASASKIICAAETYEMEALAQAEWIKFWSYFLTAKASAATQFCSTETAYTLCNSYALSSNRAEAIKVSAGTWYVPKAVFASQDWNGHYKVHMSPYNDRMVSDAGAAYPDLSAFDSLKVMHYSGSHVEGYNFGTNASSFHDALSKADVIIDTSWPHGATKADLLVKYGLDTVDSAARPRAIRDNKWYATDGTMDSRGPPYGGTDWFESRMAEPDGLLADMAIVLHQPEPSATLTYLRPVHDPAAIKIVTGSMCTDLGAPRRVRSSTCASRLSELLKVELPAAKVDSDKDDDGDDGDDGDDQTEDKVDSKASNLEEADASADNLTTILVLAVAVGVLFFVLALIAVLYYFYYYRQKDGKAIEAKQVQLDGVSTTSSAA